MSCSLYLIFEYMEHDLAGLAATPGIKFTEPQVKCYMQQLLLGLEHCHSRGILHRDIKGSNLLIDNSGILRIADFGLATFFNPNKKQPLTSRVVTLWYRPPELLLGATEYGVAVDLWSTGCILAELLMGKPIMTGRTEVEQLHKIFKLCGSPSEDYWRKSKLPHATIFKPQQPYKCCVVETFKDFPSSALALVDVLLAVETADRGTAASALKSEFFTTKPFPCDPASLPKYPPSKEFDAKLREEEARKQRAAAKGRRGESTISRGSGHSKAVPAPDANAELQASVQKRQGQSKPKSTSEKYYPEEDGRTGFPLDPLRGNAANGISHSGPLSHLKAFGSSRNGNKFKEDGIRAPFDFSRASQLSESNKQRSYAPHGGTDLSRSNTERPENHQDRSSLHWPHQKSSPTYNSVDDAEPSGKQELTHYLLDRPTSSHVKGDKIKGKESAMGVASKKKRMHYSGPLMPPAGNIDEMLKEHERQIQEAVRKARLDKSKIKKNYGEKVHSESLLHRS